MPRVAGTGRLWQRDTAILNARVGERERVSDCVKANSTVTVLLLSGMALLLAPAYCHPADWPHFRGPERTGIIAASSGFDAGRWPLGGPLWTAEVGAGGCSPILFNGRIYAFGWRDGQDSLQALDARTGSVIWRSSYECPNYSRHHASDEGCYQGPSSTPAIDPDTGLIYTLSIDGDLNCFDSADGRHVWGLDIMDTYGVPRRPVTLPGREHDYGYTSSPLVLGEWVIVEVGAAEGNLMAFDKRTGQRRWTSECRDPAGHNAGPVPMTVAGIPCVAAVTHSNLLVCRTDAGHEGETLALYPWQTHFANNIVSPAIDGENVILSSGYNISKTVRLEVSPGHVELLWETGVHSKVCTPVIHDGYVYFASRVLRCLDYETGAEVWSGGSYGDDASCIVTSDDRLVVFGNKRLALVDTARRSAGEYRELAATERLVKGFSWPHVTLTDGLLIVKDVGGILLCFDVAA